MGGWEGSSLRLNIRIFMLETEGKFTAEKNPLKLIVVSTRVAACILDLKNGSLPSNLLFLTTLLSLIDF